MKSLVPKVAGVALAATSVFGVLSSATASASTIDGTASFVTNNNASTTPLSSGNSDTPFGVSLSASPAANGTVNNRPNCSADSSTGGTFAYTYLIHQGEDPTKLNMSAGEPGALPDASSTAALVDSAGAVQTESSGPDGDTHTVAPGTGQVNLPPTQQFEWAPLTNPAAVGFPATGSGGLMYQTNGSGTPFGTWHGGYLCFKNGTTVTDYWGFTITFTQDNTTNGGSQHFTWTVVPDQPASATPEVPLPILLPLGGAALIGGGVLFSRRRNHRATAA